MDEADVKFAADELRKLIGFQIVDTVVSGDWGSYGFIVQRDPCGESIVKKACWIDCDPEGNGPGWISVEEIKEHA